MSNTTNQRDLDQRIEELVREHIAAVQRSAREANDRAFACVAGAAGKPAQTATRTAARGGKRRAPAEFSAVGERLYSDGVRTRWAQQTWRRAIAQKLSALARSLTKIPCKAPYKGASVCLLPSATISNTVAVTVAIVHRERDRPD